jgi:drug/metabolite transporter (DMT)-like permease
MSRRSWFNFCLVGVLWGLPYLLIKVAIAPGAFTPAFLVFARVLIGSAILIPYTARKGTLRPALKYYKWILLYAVLEICGPWLLISTAEVKITSGLAGLLVATVPFWATIMMSFLGDKSVWHSTRLAGLLIGFVGVSFVVGLESIRGHQNLGAIGMILIATLGYVSAPTIMSRKTPQLDGAAINAIAMVMSGAIYLPFALKDFPTHRPSAHAIEAVVALGIFPTALAFALYFTVMADFGPARASLVTYPNTAIAVVLGIIFLHEPLTIGIIVGLPLVLIGSYYASRKSKAKSAN